MYGDGFSARSARYTSTGRARNGTRQPLRQHHLEDVAGADVFLRLLDRSDETFAGEAGDEVGSRPAPRVDSVSG